MKTTSARILFFGSPIVVRVGRVVLSLSHDLEPRLVEHQPDHIGTHEVEAADAVLVLSAETVPAA